MSSIPVLVFRRQVRTAYEAALAKIKKEIEFFERELKSQGLDDRGKKSLKVDIRLLERDAKALKELIAQSRRNK